MQNIRQMANWIRDVRKERTITLEKLAELTGLSPSFISRMEAGKRGVSLEHAVTIARALSVDVGRITDEYGKEQVEAAERALPEPVERDAAPPSDAVFISGALPRPTGPRDVEKLGVAAAGEDGDFQFNGEVIDYVTRPRGLAGRPGVFALEVISDSMYPAYRKGDVIFCDRLDPKIDDDVVIETFPENGETAGKAYVKRLKRRTKSALVVEQFNPPGDLTFDPYAIKHLWRVVPNRELHGY